MKRLLRNRWTMALGARALGAYLRFALGSTAWTLHGREALGSYLRGGAAIFAFWHERLPLMPALWNLALRERDTRGRMYVLVSRHADGRLIGDIMGAFGVDVIHGSSAKGRQQRGGAASIRSLLTALRTGGQVVITPDGPRGPPRRAAPGAAHLAALAQVPIIPCGAQVVRRRALRTWDAMVMPWPFGRGVLVCGSPILVPRTGWEDRVPDIEAALTAAATEADRLCLG